jgi:hypothetical protein
MDDHPALTHEPPSGARSWAVIVSPAQVFAPMTNAKPVVPPSGAVVALDIPARAVSVGVDEHVNVAAPGDAATAATTGRAGSECASRSPSSECPNGAPLGSAAARGIRRFRQPFPLPENAAEVKSCDALRS